MTTPTPTYRDALRAAVPAWLRTGNAQKLLYAIGIQLDAVADATVAAVKVRFPGLYSAESLPLIGRERRIRRGRTETTAAYASRLIRWLDDHRRRGGPYATLAQLHAHYAPANFPIELVYYSGQRYSMDAAGTVARDAIAWTPDGDSAHWPRWWLFLHWPVSAVGPGLWDDAGAWDNGFVWDATLIPNEVTDLRLVPREWNAAHANGQIVLLFGNERLWDYPPRIWDDGSLWGTSGPAQLDIGP